MASDWNTSTLLIAVALLLAIAGALRFDLFALIWREWLKLAARRPELPPGPPLSHGPYNGKPGAQGHLGPGTRKPAYLHRSGRRG
jgi:hypothetical protein